MRRLVPLLALAALSLGFAPAPPSKAPAWLRGYRKADKRDREALLSSWLAKGGNPLDLLRASPGEDQAAAKEVLAELWRSGRLPPHAKAAALRAFAPMRLVERPSWGAAHGRRELVLQVDRQFPLPANTWLRWDYAIAVGRPARRPGSASWNTRDWEGAGPLDVGSSSSPGHFGAPVAEAIVEVWEPDRSTPGKDLWRQRWVVRPTRLHFLPRPR